MTDGIQPSAGSDDSTEGSRVVDIVQIKLMLVIDKRTGAIEWKCTGIAGEPARVVQLLGGTGTAADGPEKNVELVGRALLVLLQEHCEPFP